MQIVDTILDGSWHEFSGGSRPKTNLVRFFHGGADKWAVEVSYVFDWEDEAREDVLFELPEEVFEKLRKGLLEEGHAEATIVDPDGGFTFAWRFFRLTNEQPPTKADLEEFYHRHKWVEFLEALLRYEWWWHPGYWRDKLREPLRRGQTLQTLGEAVRFKVKQGRERLWRQLDLTNALLDSITADRERQAVLYLLWNHPKQTDIARLMGVSDAYVSKALRHVREWGWTDDDVSLARLILLTHTLASWCRRSWQEIERLDPSLAYWDEEAREWVFEEMDENERQRLLVEEARIYGELYRRVTTANETKAYFADLNGFDFGGANSHLGRPVRYRHESLTAACSSLCGVWFGWHNFET